MAITSRRQVAKLPEVMKLTAEKEKMGEEVGKDRALTPTECRQAMILTGLLHRVEFINTDQLGR